MLFKLTILLIYFYKLSISTDYLSCICDEKTTINVSECYYKVKENGSQFHSGCKCLSSFNRPYITNQRVFCLPILSHKYPVSLKCFCDQKSAFNVDGSVCIASVYSNGIVKYKSGCQCSQWDSQPKLVKEIFLSRIYVVHCIMPSFSRNLIRVRHKRQDDSDIESSTMIEDTTMEMSTSTEQSTTMEISTSTEQLTTMEISTSTEELTTTELSTTTEEPTTTELSTTTEEPTTTEISTTTEEPTTQGETSTKRRTTITSTPSTTKNITIQPITSTTTEGNGEINFGACNSTSFSRADKKTAEVMLYIASAWVILWVILTIIANIYCHAWGHHRFLDLFQELGLLAVFVFMGFFVLRPDFTEICKATRLVLQFFLMYFLLNAIMQAFFLNGLIKGRSSRNSCIPWLFNYTLPPLIAGGATAGFYFGFKDDYDGNDVHCFVEIYTDLYWTFVFPGWGFAFTAIFFNQTAITACKMSRQNVNTAQLFWAKKMCRGLPILTAWFCMCFFMLLFGIDLQRVWIIGVYMGLSILFGPILFVLHTFCYEPSSIKLFEKTNFTFYKPCPAKQIEIKEEDVKVDLRKRHPLTDPIIPTNGYIENADLPPRPVGAMSTLNPPMASSMNIMGNNSDLEPLEYDPTSPQELYNWLTDKNTENVNDAENVMFKKNV